MQRVVLEIDQKDNNNTINAPTFWSYYYDNIKTQAMCFGGILAAIPAIGGWLVGSVATAPITVPLTCILDDKDKEPLKYPGLIGAGIAGAGPALVGGFIGGVFFAPFATLIAYARQPKPDNAIKEQIYKLISITDEDIRNKIIAEILNRYQRGSYPSASSMMLISLLNSKAKTEDKWSYILQYISDKSYSDAYTNNGKALFNIIIQTSATKIKGNLLPEQRYVMAAQLGEINDMLTLHHNPSITTDIKNYAIEHATHMGQLEIVQYLVTSGATALEAARDQAKQIGHTEMTDYLTWEMKVADIGFEKLKQQLKHLLTMAHLPEWENHGFTIFSYVVPTGVKWLRTLDKNIDAMDRHTVSMLAKQICEHDFGSTIWRDARTTQGLYDFARNLGKNTYDDYFRKIGLTTVVLTNEECEELEKNNKETHSIAI